MNIQGGSGKFRLGWVWTDFCHIPNDWRLASDFHYAQGLEIQFNSESAQRVPCGSCVTAIITLTYARRFKHLVDNTGNGRKLERVWMGIMG